jgi:hypothetical protein
MSVAKIAAKIKLLEAEKRLLQHKESLKGVSEISEEGINRLLFILGHLDVCPLTMHLKGQVAPGSTITEADANAMKNYAGRSYGDIEKLLLSCLERRQYPVLDQESLFQLAERASEDSYSRFFASPLRSEKVKWLLMKSRSDVTFLPEGRPSRPFFFFFFFFSSPSNMTPKKKISGHKIPKALQCPSCGQAGHSRSTHHLCPNKVHRQGAKRPHNDEEETHFQVQEVRSIKRGLAGFVKDDALHEKIGDLVAKMTRNSFWASRLINLIVQQKIEEGETLPDVTSRTWIQQFFTHNFHGSQETFGIPAPAPVPSQVVCIAARDYAINVCVHLQVAFACMYKRFLHFKFRVLPTRKSRNQMVAACLQELESGNTGEHASFPFLLGGEETNAEKLKLMHEWNIIFVRTGAKQFNLLPQFTTKAKYVTIDTDVLHALVPHKGVSRKDFGSNREDNWKTYFKLPKRFFRADRRFACEIGTDGKAVSIVMRRWKRVERDGEARAAKRNKEAAFEVDADTRMVGLDPGRKDLATAVDDDERVFLFIFGHFWHILTSINTGLLAFNKGLLPPMQVYGAQEVVGGEAAVAGAPGVCADAADQQVSLQQRDPCLLPLSTGEQGPDGCGLRARAGQRGAAQAMEVADSQTEDPGSLLPEAAGRPEGKHDRFLWRRVFLPHE